MNRADPKEITLHTGGFFFGGGMRRLSTVLGTCVAITLWHPARRIGGMCHFLLPRRGAARSQSGSSPGFYADEVMELFARELHGAHSSPREYVVKVFGGGNMFPSQLERPACRAGSCGDAERLRCTNVGCQNIGAARALLANAGYSIRVEDVGGHGSRQVAFDLASGDVWIQRGAVIVPAAEVAA